MKSPESQTIPRLLQEQTRRFGEREALVDAHRRPGVRRAELYATRSLLQSALRKAAALYADEAPCTQLRALEEEVGRAYESGAPLPPPLAVDEED